MAKTLAEIMRNPEESAEEFVRFHHARCQDLSDIQYVTDADGERLAVIIPIAQWQRLLHKIHGDTYANQCSGRRDNG